MGMEQHFFSGVFFSLIVFIVIAFFLISKISSLIQFNQKLNKQIKNINERIDSNSNQIIAISDNLLSAKDDKLNLIEFPKNLDNKMNDFIKVIVNSSKRTYEIVNNEQRASLNDIKTIMSTFDDTIKSKSKELKIYKEGYDYIKNKNILDGIIFDKNNEKFSFNDDILFPTEHLKILLENAKKLEIAPGIKELILWFIGPKRYAKIKDKTNG